MLDFTKKKEYLICIDSDGTVMDTMTVKHEKCFGPALIEVLGIHEHQDDILKRWLEINLYEKTRGINRFQGFYDICCFMQENYGMHFDGIQDFKEWVMTTKEFSVSSIRKYMEKAKDTSLFEKAIDWSKLVNEKISSLPPSKPFDGVKDVLEYAMMFADLIGVSSANKEAVKEEWTRLDLMKCFAFVGCQDIGNKASIISQALESGYAKENVIMLGDAIGDYDAAKKNGVWFFPIIPKHEVESWASFEKEGLIHLLSGKFDSAYQKKLLDTFYSSLNS